MFDAPPGAGPFEALLRDIAMRAFDLAGADRQIVGQGVTIVQVVRPIAQIEMASPHRRLIVVCVGRFDAGSERRQHVVETPGFERFLLRVHPGVFVWRDRLGGGTQILANMIKINQVAALRAKLLFHLTHDPGRSVPDRVNVGVGAKAGPDRAGEKLPSGGFDAALDRAGIDRRLAPLGVREAKLGLSPRQRLALTLVLLAGVRLHDRDHAAIRLSDNLLVKTRRLGKILRSLADFEHDLGMAQSNPLDRALADLEAVVLLQLDPRLSERLIGGKVGDGALQRP